MKNIEYVTTKEELAKNIKMIREARGLRHREVAELLHIERSTYTYYENAKCLPELFTILKLTEIFNVNLYDLITRNGWKKAFFNMRKK